MKHRLILALILCCCGLAHGQQQYFLYLQTDNRQPFYVRLHDKLYSSAESGYLILAGLSGDSSYTLTAGFPKNAFPEQAFTINPGKRDEGFLLKNFGDKGWGLFNLRTLAVIMNNESTGEKKNYSPATVKKNDPFSVLLANAVNDTAVLFTLVKPKAAPAAAKEPLVSKTPVPAATKPETPLVAKEEPKQQAPVPVTTNSTANSQVPVKEIVSGEKPAVHPPAEKAVHAATEAVASSTAAPPEKTAKPVNEPVTASSAPLQPEKPLHGGVSKAAELRTDTSWIAVFIDASAGSEDTVHVSIPFDRWVAIKQHQVAESKAPVAVVKEIKPQQDSIITPQQRQGIAANENRSAAVSPVTEAAKQEPLLKQQRTNMNSAAITEAAKKPRTDGARAVANKAIEPAVAPDLAGKNAATANPPQKDSLASTAVKSGPSASKTPANADSSAAVFAAQVKPSIPNSNCKDSAWDSDVDKLRIKMLATKTDEEKMALAAKLYKVKCLTVKQVKALSELFISDEGKYKWFDSAYPYVTDSGNFPMLGELLSDKYYQNRFKAMLR